MGCLVLTIENRADGIPAESSLLLEVQNLRDRRSVRTAGPQLVLRVGHGLGECEGVSPRRAGWNLGGGDSKMERRPQSSRERSSLGL